jgi:hypothetical protein
MNAARGIVWCVATYACAATAHVAARSSSPEGYWLGTTGNEKERIEVGLEIRRAADGTPVM